MPNLSGVPAFGGYFTKRVGVNTEVLHAWWADGSIATWNEDTGRWERGESPSFAALFPDRVTREPEPMPEGVWVPWAGPERVLGMHFRGDLPAQPRPDDADPLTYPARGGRDD